MGLQGQEAVAFVKEQQEIAREETQHNREEAQLNREEAQRQREADDRAREEAQHNREEVARQREYELALRQLDNERAPMNPERNNSKAPKLPSFLEGKNQIDNLIQRFERYA